MIKGYDPARFARSPEMLKEWIRLLKASIVRRGRTKEGYIKFYVRRGCTKRGSLENYKDDQDRLKAMEKSLEKMLKASTCHSHAN